MWKFWKEFGRILKDFGKELGRMVVLFGKAFESIREGLEGFIRSWENFGRSSEGFLMLLDEF